ncbi:MAG: hypothetical protein H0T62_13990 [Parachlamydiaceae bacterium]|nr:hypothetical protein [Parachlamydiaceae bacterium]
MISDSQFRALTKEAIHVFFEDKAVANFDPNNENNQPLDNALRILQEFFINLSSPNNPFSANNTEAIVLAAKRELNPEDFEKFKILFTKFENVKLDRENSPEAQFYGAINAVFINRSEIL